jgi:hypothetical protein
LVVVRALVLLGAVCFTMAAYLRQQNFTTVVAAVLWLVWIFAMIHA